MKKLLFGAMLLALAISVPYSNNGAGIGTSWYLPASTNCVFSTTRNDTATWYRCLRCPWLRR